MADWRTRVEVTATAGQPSSRTRRPATREDYITYLQLTVQLARSVRWAAELNLSVITLARDSPDIVQSSAWRASGRAVGAELRETASLVQNTTPPGGLELAHELLRQWAGHLQSEASQIESFVENGDWSALSAGPNVEQSKAVLWQASASKVKEWAKARGFPTG